MKRLLLLLSVCAMVLAIAPYHPAEAGVIFNFNLSCNGANGVLTFTGSPAPGTFDIYLNGTQTATYSSNSTFQYTFTGPGTWLVEVFYVVGPYVPQANGKIASQPDKTRNEKGNAGITPIFTGNISCASTGVVEPPCFPDGRMNANCAAPIAVYLLEDEDGVSLDIWRIMPDTSGQPEMFFTPEDLDGEGLRVVGTSGNIVLFQLASGEYQINVWLGFKVYVLRFTMPDGAVTFEGEIDLF